MLLKRWTIESWAGDGARPGVWPRVSLVAILVCALACVAIGCAGRPFAPAGVDPAELRARAVVKEDGPVRVLAAVPSNAEVNAIFAAALHGRGIQPVWLEIQYSGPVALRFAPVSMDRDYFSPLEVAYMHRSGLSKQGLADMERSYRDGAMPRRVGAGETHSGFVFTHLAPGSKAFNVDLFGSGQGTYGFTFVVEVPDFVPDHESVDFERLYTAEEILSYDDSGLRQALYEMPCCTRSQPGNRPGAPLNLVLVGEGEVVRHSLLRAGWNETERMRSGSLILSSPHWKGRRPDAIFRKLRSQAGERNDLLLWLAPMRVDGKPVWVAQVTHYVSNLLTLTFLDPDIDNARNYIVQDLWYSQALAKVAWLKGAPIVSPEEQRRNLVDDGYFTDGLRTVLWLSKEPASPFEVQHVAWDRLED